MKTKRLGRPRKGKSERRDLRLVALVNGAEASTILGAFYDSGARSFAEWARLVLLKAARKAS